MISKKWSINNKSIKEENLHSKGQNLSLSRLFRLWYTEEHYPLQLPEEPRIGIVKHVRSTYSIEQLLATQGTRKDFRSPNDDNSWTPVTSEKVQRRKYIILSDHVFRMTTFSCYYVATTDINCRIIFMSRSCGFAYAHEASLLEFRSKHPQHMGFVPFDKFSAHLLTLEKVVS